MWDLPKDLRNFSNIDVYHLGVSSTVFLRNPYALKTMQKLCDRPCYHFSWIVDRLWDLSIVGPLGPHTSKRHHETKAGCNCTSLNQTLCSIEVWCNWAWALWGIVLIRICSTIANSVTSYFINDQTDANHRACERKAHVTLCQRGLWRLLRRSGVWCRWTWS